MSYLYRSGATKAHLLLACLLPSPVLAADTVETWKGAFEHFEISGLTTWTPPDEVAPGHIPVTATWKFAYTLGSTGGVLQTAVTDPRGFVRRVAFDARGIAGGS